MAKPTPTRARRAFTWAEIWPLLDATTPPSPRILRAVADWLDREEAEGGTSHHIHFARTKLVRLPTCPIGVLRRYATCPAADVQRALATSLRCPLEVLVALAREDGSVVAERALDVLFLRRDNLLTAPRALRRTVARFLPWHPQPTGAYLQGMQATFPALLGTLPLVEQAHALAALVVAPDQADRLRVWAEAVLLALPAPATAHARTAVLEILQRPAATPATRDRAMTLLVTLTPSARPHVRPIRRATDAHTSASR